MAARPELIAPRLDRATRRIDFTDECWLWTGALAKDGYARIMTNGRATVAHRAVWEEVVGPIPEALTLDHLCRACWRAWYDARKAARRLP